jgi:hypothetical protein
MVNHNEKQSPDYARIRPENIYYGPMANISYGYYY